MVMRILGCLIKTSARWTIAASRHANRIIDGHRTLSSWKLSGVDAKNVY